MISVCFEVVAASVGGAFSDLASSWAQNGHRMGASLTLTWCILVLLGDLERSGEQTPEPIEPLRMATSAAAFWRITSMSWGSSWRLFDWSTQSTTINDINHWSLHFWHQIKNTNPGTGIHRRCIAFSWAPVPILLADAFVQGKPEVQTFGKENRSPFAQTA